MTPNILEVVAAFEAAERQRLTAEKEAADKVRAAKEAREDACEAELVKILTELAEPLERLRTAHKPGISGLDIYSRDKAARSFWELWDHRAVMRLAVRPAESGFLYLMGKPAQHGFHSVVDGSFSTKDGVEFRVAVAKWIGTELARRRP